MYLAPYDQYFSHPSFQTVLKHRLFHRMARKRLNSDQLIDFFVVMADFCGASRPCGRLPEALRELGHTESAATIERIAASEAGHGPSLEEMAIELIYSGHEVSSIAQRAKWAELQHLVSGDLLKPTFDVMQIFASRRYEGVVHVPRAIGTMLAVEMIAHESIIPGEVMVFTSNPHYPGFPLDHPSMAYLKKHAGADGAEAEHAALMQSLVTGDLIDYRDSIDAGFDEACIAVATWYSAIQEVLFEGR